MLNLRPRRISVGISPGSVVVSATQGVWRRKSQIVAGRTVAPDKLGVLQHLCDLLAALVAEHGLQGSSARLVLSDALVRLWLVEPPANVGALSDLKAAASSRFQSLFGESPSTWDIRGDWQADRPFVASALPQVWLQALNGVLQTSRLQAEAISPHSVVALNRWSHRMTAGSWLFLYQDRRVTLLILDAQSALAGLRHVQCGPQEIADEFSCSQFLRLQAMLMGVPMPPVIYIPDLIMELGWVRYARGAQPQYRVLQKALPEDGLLSSAAALALAGA